MFFFNNLCKAWNMPLSPNILKYFGNNLRSKNQFPFSFLFFLKRLYFRPEVKPSKILGWSDQQTRMFLPKMFWGSYLKYRRCSKIHKNKTYPLKLMTWNLLYLLIVKKYVCQREAKKIRKTARQNEKRKCLAGSDNF